MNVQETQGSGWSTYFTKGWTACSEIISKAYDYCPSPTKVKAAFVFGLLLSGGVLGAAAPVARPLRRDDSNPFAVEPPQTPARFNVGPQDPAIVELSSAILISATGLDIETKIYEQGMADTVSKFMRKVQSLSTKKPELKNNEILKQDPLQPLLNKIKTDFSNDEIDRIVDISRYKIDHFPNGEGEFHPSMFLEDTLLISCRMKEASRSQSLLKVSSYYIQKTISQNSDYPGINDIANALYSGLAEVDFNDIDSAVQGFFTLFDRVENSIRPVSPIRESSLEKINVLKAKLLFLYKKAAYLHNSNASGKSLFIRHNSQLLVTYDLFTLMMTQYRNLFIEAGFADAAEVFIPIKEEFRKLIEATLKDGIRQCRNSFLRKETQAQIEEYKKLRGDWETKLARLSQMTNDLGIDDGGDFPFESTTHSLLQILAGASTGLAAFFLTCACKNRKTPLKVVVVDHKKEPRQRIKVVKEPVVEETLFDHLDKDFHLVASTYRAGEKIEEVVNAAVKAEFARGLRCTKNQLRLLVKDRLERGDLRMTHKVVETYIASLEKTEAEYLNEKINIECLRIEQAISTTIGSVFDAHLDCSKEELKQFVKARLDNDRTIITYFAGSNTTMEDYLEQKLVSECAAYVESKLNALAEGKTKANAHSLILKRAEEGSLKKYVSNKIFMEHYKVKYLSFGDYVNSFLTAKK